MNCECRPGMMILRWAARLTGSALFLLVLASTIGEGGPPDPLQQPPAVAVQFLLLAVMTLGLVVALRWEFAGAMATLLGLAAFNAVEVASSPGLAGGAFPLFAVPALLYLAHATLMRVRARAGSPSAGDLCGSVMKSDAEIGATPNSYDAPRRYLE